MSQVQEDLWRSNALRTLPALMEATDMMVCGEDLGMIPACVPPVMEQLGLVGARPTDACFDVLKPPPVPAFPCSFVRH